MTESPQLRVERRIAARPADVYAYLTESALWSRWQGISASHDPVPGGRFEMVMANGGVAEGRFIELVPERRVVFTWGWRGDTVVPPGSSTVEIELQADGDGTLIQLTHRDLPPDQQPIHRMGWEHYLPRLAIAAAGGEPGEDSGPG